nr:reverse transcriptase domain-containing protein [Tanacetum cinerariifolium]
MIAILEKYELNTDFHQIVDFVEASYLRYALTINPTVHVSHIRQFWSTVRIETTDEGTKILATVDGKLRTIFESSIRRNLKLRDKAGNSSLPDAEIFENLTLMGYNILPNQNSNIATALVCLATNRVYNFSKMIFDGMVRNVNNKVSKFLMYPRQYTRRARIAQSSALTPVADEPASPIGDDSQATVLSRGVSVSISPVTEVFVAEVPTGSATVLSRGVSVSISPVTGVFVAEVPTGSGSIPTARPPGTGVPTGGVSTGSGSVPTASLIFTTAAVATPYTRRKGKENMIESETPKKKKLQEQMDVQMARQLEEEMERDAQRIIEQIARDAEIAMIHAEEELQIMIDGLDRNNETVAKYLQEYYQFARDLPIEERIELISNLVKYKDNYAKVLKYQIQQRKPLSGKQQKELYKSVLKSHAGWKVRHFKGMTLEEIKQKFDPVWKQFQDFILIEEVSEEDLKALMLLVPVEEVKERQEKDKIRSKPDKNGKHYLKACGIVQHLTPPYTPQHNGVSKRINRTLLDMVRSMINLTTLPLSFWNYALESVKRILNMVPTKKVDKTPYELWYGKVPILSYIKVWGCEVLVKRDTPDKLQQRSVKCIFIGYPKETMGYYFYFPPENKIVVASEIPIEAEGFEPPQEEVIPIRRSQRTHLAPNCLCLNVEVEEHNIGDLNELASYKAVMSSSKLSYDQTSNPTSSTNPTPKGRIRRSSKQKVENSNNAEDTLPPPVPMAENQTMAQLLQAPTDGALLLDKKNQYSAPTPSPTLAPIKAVESNYVTCGGTHAYQNCPATSGNVYQDNIQEVRTLPGNTITNTKEDLKGITTRSGVAYQGPTIPTPSKVAKQGTEVTKDQVKTPNSQSTAPVQPTVIQYESETLVSKPVSALMPNLKPSIPYPSRRDKERRRDQANEQIDKFYEIFKDISFEISFTDTLMLMPKFASTLKALIGNKEKLGEMARTPMNEHCLAVILNKLPKKLRDPEKFLIPCELPRMGECLALADLGASINLMPLSVWKGLSLPELTVTCMTLELVYRTVSKPIGIAKDVKVKVGVFHFPADFVVVDFKPDPRVPLILERCFLKTDRALIDVHKGNIDVAETPE